MAFVLNDRVKETTTTTGTGTINLAGAETGFETFVQGIGNSNSTYYAIAHSTLNEFEIGIGTVTDASPDTLSRTTIISSTNSDAAVDFSAGTKDVFCTLPASKAVVVPGSGDLEFNAPGDDFSFKNSSNTIAFIKTTNNDFIIQNNLNDKDFILKGYDSDGGGLITALSIDYSDQGNATFNKNIIFPDNGKALFGAGTDLAIFSDGTDGKIQASGSLILDADGTTISLRDGGTENSQIGLDSAGLVLTVVGADKDFFVSGDDGGTAITAFRADMSDAGRILAYGGVNIEANTDISFTQGTWTGEKSYKIQAHSGNLYLQSDYFFFRDAGGTNNASIDSSGNAIFLNNVTAYGTPSDIKLKEDIEVIDNAVDKVKQLRGITYTLKSDGNRLTGLIAQDLEKVLPEAVYTSETIPDEINGIEAEEHLAIRYGNTVGLLVEAIKEQQEQIDTLNDYVKLQSATIMDMERRLNELEDK